MKSTIADRFYDIVVSPPSEVIDNLTSNSPTASLSARQGKVLKDLIENSNSSGTVNYDIMAGAGITQNKSYRRYYRFRPYNNSSYLEFSSVVCSSNDAIYTIEETINPSSATPYIHGKEVYISCAKDRLHKIDKWFQFSQLTRPEIDTANAKVTIMDASFSPQLNKICIVGSHGYIGMIDCANTNDISLQKSTFSTNFHNLANNGIKSYLYNLFELPYNTSGSGYDNWNLFLSYQNIFKITNVKWIENKAKFYSMSQLIYQNSFSNYQYKTLILSSNDGMNWEKVCSFPGILRNWCYIEDTDKFYAIHALRHDTQGGPGPRDCDYKLMVSTNDCASWIEVPITNKPDINTLYNFFLGGIAYSKTKKTCVIYGNLSYRSTGSDAYENITIYKPFIIRSINGGPFQIETSLKKYNVFSDIYDANDHNNYNINKTLVWIPEIDAFMHTLTSEHSISISKDGINWYDYTLGPANSSINYISGSNITRPVPFGQITYLKYTNEVYLKTMYASVMDKVISLSA